MRAGLLLLLSLVASSSLAEEAGVLELARETISRVRYPAFITVDEAGQPRARTVDAFAPDEDFTVWIATRPNTRKVAHIRHNSQVTLYYFDAERRNYVTIMGHARLVDDPLVKTRMRRPSDTERLYPAFPDDYLLIEVKPDRLEGILPGHRGDPDNWAPAGVDFTRD